jgi:hypothetical protein
MVESSLTEVTIPLAAASTGVFSGTMKSIACARVYSQTRKLLNISKDIWEKISCNDWQKVTEEMNEKGYALV